MKQTKSLIAAIAVLSMFSIAKAEGPIVDFDRAAAESQHFTDYSSRAPQTTHLPWKQ